MNDLIPRLIANERERLKRDVSDLVSNVNDLASVHDVRTPPMSYVNSVQSALDNVKRRLIRIGAMEDAS